MPFMLDGRVWVQRPAVTLSHQPLVMFWRVDVKTETTHKALTCLRCHVNKWASCWIKVKLQIEAMNSSSKGLTSKTCLSCTKVDLAFDEVSFCNCVTLEKHMWILWSCSPMSSCYSGIQSLESCVTPETSVDHPKLHLWSSYEQETGADFICFPVMYH